MDKQTSPVAATAGSSARPSLYGNHPPQSKSAEAFSILGGLEPRRYKFAVFRRTAWSASLLTLTAVALLVGLNGGFRNSEASPAPMELAGNEPQAEAAHAEPAASVPANVKPEMATIVNESVPEGSRQTGVADVPSVAVTESKPEETIVVAALTRHDAAAPKPAADIATTEAMQTPVPGKAQAAANKTVAKTASPAPKPARMKAGDAGKDKDVDLIAALLAHVSADTSAAQGKSAGKKSGNAVVAARATPASAVARRERSPATNRDIVTRESAESLETLVSRCRSLGFFEGELCRLRICSGMWGKDPACPVSSPPSSS